MSRPEFTYRDNESTNGRKDHPLCRLRFPSFDGLMAHFSFEVDTVRSNPLISHRFWPGQHWRTRLGLAEKDVVREPRYSVCRCGLHLLHRVEHVFLKSLGQFQKLEKLILLTPRTQTEPMV